MSLRVFPSLTATPKKTKKTKEPEAPILYDDPPDKMTSKDGRSANMKITSWNVDGLRAWVKKNGLDVSLQPEALNDCSLRLHFEWFECLLTSVVGAGGEPGCFVPARDKVC